MSSAANLLSRLLLARTSRSNLLAPQLRRRSYFRYQQCDGFPKTGLQTCIAPLGQIPQHRAQTLPYTGTRPSSTPRYCSTCPLRSGSSGLAVATSLVLLFSLLYLHLPAPLCGETPSSPQAPEQSADPVAMTTANIPAGRPGNTTPEQEEQLRRLWSLLLRVFGRDDVNGVGVIGVAESPITTTEQPAVAQTDKTKKKRGLFGRKNAPNAASDPSSPSVTSVIEPSSLNEADPDDKYGQVQQYLDTLAKQSPDSIRDTLWSMVKHDHPDALLLRFLRARKWDVEKALVMLISTMNWRSMEMHVDDDIMKNGEGGAAAAEKGQDGAAKVLGHDFLAQMRMGKAFIHGRDKAGRPICFVRVRLHRQGEHAEEALERSTVFIIETARMLLNPPVDTATIIFDMTGFSMANMDYTPVKFMIKCFEANYPESLGAVLVYKAPWVFQGIWKIIRGWLDPVVASKVHFLNNSKDMAAYVDLEGLPKEVDGLEEWEYHYDEPAEGENADMTDVTTRDRLMDTRRQLIDAYEQETLKWIKNGGGETAAACKESRDATAARLKENYWELDPYLRARSLYDRCGMIKPGGGIDFYPDKNVATNNGAGEPAIETSVDDVD